MGDKELVASLMRKGQMSAEFMLSLGIMLLVFLLLAGVASERYTQAQSEHIDGGARSILETFVMHVNAVHVSGDGAKAVLELSQSIDTPGDYNISIYPGSNLAMIIYDSPTGSKYYMTPMTTAAISGKISDIIGTVTITNEKEVIVLG
jgi:uncharacterized protein (UPF0333 family)